MTTETNPEATHARLLNIFEQAEAREMNRETLTLELAEILGVNRVTVYRWRNGDISLRPLTCRALDAAMADLSKRYDFD